MGRLFSFLVVTITCAVLTAGCGVEPASAPHALVQPTALKIFPRQDWRLPSARLFLWKDGTAAPVMTRALTISTEMDDLDGQAMPLNGRHLELDASTLPLRNSLRQVTGDLIPIRTALAKANGKKADAESRQAKAKQDLAAEEAKPHPDPSVIGQLNGQIALLETEGQDAIGEIADLAPAQNRLQKEQADLRASLQPLQDETKQIEAQQNAIMLQGRQVIEELMGLVDWYHAQPSSVSFQFSKDGTLAIDISGWDLGDGAGARELSTTAPAGKKPTIGKTGYEEVGGVFSFEGYIYDDDAQTKLRETYSFRLGRTKYDTTDGRRFFGGEIKRTTQAGVRYGLAELVGNQ